MKLSSIKIESEVHKKAKKYCKENGLSVQWFLSRAAEEKIKRDKK